MPETALSLKKEDVLIVGVQGVVVQQKYGSIVQNYSLCPNATRFLYGQKNRGRRIYFFQEQAITGKRIADILRENDIFSYDGCIGGQESMHGFLWAKHALQYPNAICSFISYKEFLERVANAENFQKAIEDLMTEYELQLDPFEITVIEDAIKERSLVGALYIMMTRLCTSRIRPIIIGKERSRTLTNIGRGFSLPVPVIEVCSKEGTTWVSRELEDTVNELFAGDQGTYDNFDEMYEAIQSLEISYSDTPPHKDYTHNGIIRRFYPSSARNHSRTIVWNLQ
jgi:hypothetical protein